MWRIAGRYSAVGIEMTAAVTVGSLGGAWLDAKLGTSPYALLLGMVVGIGAATLTVVRLVRGTDLRRL